MIRMSAKPPNRRIRRPTTWADRMRASPSRSIIVFRARFLTHCGAVPIVVVAYRATHLVPRRPRLPGTLWSHTASQSSNSGITVEPDQGVLDDTS